MPTDNPTELFSKDYGHPAFNGLMISRQRGDMILLPVHEITWVAATPLGEGGCVEIRTRQHLIRLGLSRMDACRKFIELFFKDGLSRITEGTAPVEADRGFDDPNRGKVKAQPVTLVIEITERDEDENISTGGGSPAPHAVPPSAANLGGFGFPTL